MKFQICRMCYLRFQLYPFFLFCKLKILFSFLSESVLKGVHNCIGLFDPFPLFNLWFMLAYDFPTVRSLLLITCI
jgi:hypothetical protein